MNGVSVRRQLKPAMNLPVATQLLIVPAGRGPEQEDRGVETAPLHKTATFWAHQGNT